MHLQTQLTVRIMVVLIKIRHILDQAWTRFLRECICRPRRWQLMQAKFPICGSPEQLHKQIQLALQNAETNINGSVSVASLHIAVSVETNFNDAVWQAVCTIQPFHGSSSSSWIQDLYEAKHVRLHIDSLSDVLNRIRSFVVKIAPSNTRWRMSCS